MDASKLPQLIQTTGETSHVSIEMYVQCSTWNILELFARMFHMEHRRNQRR